MVNYLTTKEVLICQPIFIEKWLAFRYKHLMAIERKSYNTTLRTDLAKKLRILAAQLEKRQNELLEEAIQDLLKKYEEEDKK